MRTLALVCALSLLALGCDSSDPVAPTGSILTISASPSSIASNGKSSITVVARKSTGFPVNPGTVVHFSTTLGTLSGDRGSTDDDGVVRVTLSGNGAAGIATVTALTGAASDASVDVVIGLS